MSDQRDYLIFTPGDVDLARSPLRASLDASTYVLGAFNPGFTRLPSGNLLMMVRVAEALTEPVEGDHVRAIRWTRDGYVLDNHLLTGVAMTDPRQFEVGGAAYRQLALTSLSWLLPVELSADARQMIAVHYDKAIAPVADYQQYGVEDARITRIGDTWYMTSCSVSAERHSTTLHTSTNGLDYRLEGIVLDHQNKDMVLFEGLVGGKFMAITRPLGEVYFAYPEGSPYLGGPSINLAQSPDSLHWKPLDQPFLRARKGSQISMKMGGGSQPILTEAGWLMIYHGVETRAKIGIYRSFWALLDKDEPWKILRVEDGEALIEASPGLTAPIAHQLYLPTEVVFTTGLADGGADYIVASGEADLACRITHIAKSRFA